MKKMFLCLCLALFAVSAVTVAQETQKPAEPKKKCCSKDKKCHSKKQKNCTCAADKKCAKCAKHEGKHKGQPEQKS